MRCAILYHVLHIPQSFSFSKISVKVASLNKLKETGMHFVYLHLKSYNKIRQLTILIVPLIIH